MTPTFRQAKQYAKEVQKVRTEFLREYMREPLKCPKHLLEEVTTEFFRLLEIDKEKNRKFRETFLKDRSRLLPLSTIDRSRK